MSDDDARPHDGLDPLTRFAIARGTDKFGVHLYTPHYHRWLAHFRDRPITLLEFGVGGYDDPTSGGASLRMWRDYFPLARIVGVDILPKRLADMDGIDLRIGSQADPAFVARLVAEYGAFDIVIDDASHRSDDVIACLDLVFPHVTMGGIYIIEDTQTSYWPSFGGGEGADLPTSMNYAKQLFDAIDHAERRDVGAAHPLARTIKVLARLHNLLIIEKGDNDEPSSLHNTLDHPKGRAALAAYEAIAPEYGDETSILMLAHLLERASRPADALARLRGAIATPLRSARLELAAGRLAATLGRIEEARRHFQAALDVVTEDLSPLVELARHPALQDLLRHHAAHLDRRLAMAPLTVRRRFQAGLVRCALGEEDAAEALFMEIQADEGVLDADIASHIGDFFARRGLAAAARRAFSRAVATAEKDGALRARYAAALLRAGDLEAAEAEADAALALNPSMGSARLLRARIRTMAAASRRQGPGGA